MNINYMKLINKNTIYFLEFNLKFKKLIFNNNNW